MNEAGADARRLAGHLSSRHSDLLRGPQVQALRQVLLQNYHGDCAGCVRWHDDDDAAGLPPSASSPLPRLRTVVRRKVAQLGA